MLTPLLRHIGCVVFWTTTGAETSRIHRAKDPFNRFDTTPACDERTDRRTLYEVTHTTVAPR